MTVTEVTEIMREALWVTIKLSLPVLLVALIVGLVVSLFQALTQIQEMTLSFIPKILSVFAALVFLFPFMLTTLMEYTIKLFDRLQTVGAS
jgi:flagellar biosynthetic protein FliQ